MSEALGEVVSYLFLKDLAHTLDLGKPIDINRPPVTISLIHQTDQAPENRLFIRDVEQKQRYDVVEALDVANLSVVVCVGLQNVK